MSDVVEFHVNAPYDRVEPPKICLVCGAPGKVRVRFNYRFLYSTIFDEGLPTVWIGALVVSVSVVLMYIVGPRVIALPVVGVALLTMGSRRRKLPIEMYICDRGVHPQEAFEGAWIGTMKQTLIPLQEKRMATFAFADRDFARAFKEANPREVVDHDGPP